MDTSLGVIKIAYGGTLGYPLHPPKSFWSKKVRPWLWTYNNLSINDPSTRSADILIKAIKTLDSANSINPEKLKVHLWGKIHKRHVEYIKHCNLSQYFTIEGFKTKEETLNALKNANILFLPLETGIGQNQPLFIPGKLFEYLSFQKPILLLADKSSDSAKILEKSGLGLICNPNDVTLLTNLLFKIINHKLGLTQLTPNIDYIQAQKFDVKTKALAQVFDSLLST